MITTKEAIERSKNWNIGDKDLQNSRLLTIEELLYIYGKWGDKHPSEIPGKLTNFVDPVSFEPACRIQFNNGRDVYYTMSTAFEAKKKIDAANNRSQT